MCLVFLSFMCVPAFSQAGTKSFETLLIDNFDNPDSVDWTWHVQGSRFSTEDFPKLQYFEGIPTSLRAFANDPDAKHQVLGVQSKFDRKGNNWFEIIPMSKEDSSKPYEIPLKGNVSQIDIWVWGANYDYTLEMILRDANGMIRVFDVGKMNYIGWRNHCVKIPTNFVQRSSLRSGLKNAYLIGFRVRTSPYESVDDFAIYFDQIKYQSDTFIDVYDGYELEAAFNEEAGK